MKIEEQLKIINSVPKTELAKYLAISRQMLYIKLRDNKDIDKIYKAALNIKNKTIPEEIVEKEETEKYKKELNSAKIKIEILEEKIAQYKKDKFNVEIYKKYKELKEQYDKLIKRYDLQSQELVMMKIEISKYKEVK